MQNTNQFRQKYIFLFISCTAQNLPNFESRLFNMQKSTQARGSSIFVGSYHSVHSRWILKEIIQVLVFHSDLHKHYLKGTLEGQCPQRGGYGEASTRCQSSCSTKQTRLQSVPERLSISRHKRFYGSQLLTAFSHICFPSFHTSVSEPVCIIFHLSVYDFQ